MTLWIRFSRHCAPRNDGKQGAVQERYWYRPLEGFIFFKIYGSIRPLDGKEGYFRDFLLFRLSETSPDHS